MGAACAVQDTNRVVDSTLLCEGPRHLLSKKQKSLAPDFEQRLPTVPILRPDYHVEFSNDPASLCLVTTVIKSADILHLDISTRLLERARGV